MQVIATVAEMAAARASVPGGVGLVPTMGFLHEGHLSLVERARRDNEALVVSIFVNPAQFAPSEDLDRYPRDMDRDLELLARERADVVFVPTAEEMYPPGFDDWVDLQGPLVDRLEGASRPGFFRGVCTVVARLFRIVQPDRAYFGQKDAQQLRVIRQMVRDLALPVEIVPMPIVREPDGLAMSSRNAYLSPDQRENAIALSRALDEARQMVQDGVRDADRIRSRAQAILDETEGVSVDYISVADEQTLHELDVVDRPALLLLAARVGATRLIDNTILVPPGVAVSPLLADLLE
ncbi:MAG: pantoate--beta-alanine ligase [Chloroflexi bacterium]|nr:pantoate--beta-alanine ligase [Chloroflexota bacterium]